MRSSFAAVLFSCFLLIAFAAPAVGDEPIRIGLAAELTGPRAMNGIDRMRGAEMAVDAINAAGGVLGRPLELVVEDTRGEIATAMAVAERFTEVHRVPAVIETCFSFILAAIHEVYWDAGIPFTMAGSAPVLTTLGNPYMFRVRPNDLLTAAVMANYGVETLGAERVAIAHVIDDFGAGGKDATVEALADLFGLEPVAIVGIPLDIVDATGPVMELAAANPDVVIQFAHAYESAHVYKSRYELDQMDIPWIVSMGGIDPTAVEMAGVEATKNVFGVADFGDDEPAVRVFRQQYQAIFDEDILTHECMHGWDAVHLLALAMEKAGVVEPEAIRNALINTHVRGIRFDIQVREDGETIFENKVLEMVDGLARFRELVRLPFDYEF